ncbi:hypothetical protein HDV05_000656 [Chytridiales sp. JEL 0842]|nr:hypothetical protein HDV05_000656 [Chytridiales sp. JEL 0842]
MAAQRFYFPVEALSSIGVIAVIGFAYRFGLAKWQEFENDGKIRRYNVDRWDRRMMERDSRLTGNVNVQRAEAEAPPAFKTNSALEVERPFF